MARKGGKKEGFPGKASGAQSVVCHQQQQVPGKWLEANILGPNSVSISPPGNSDDGHCFWVKHPLGIPTLDSVIFLKPRRCQFLWRS